MAWSETEVETILEQMRGGATVSHGVSRCHRTYFFRDSEWLCEDFDEGHTQEHPSSEAEVRMLITREPELFRGVLKASRWRPFSAAFLANQPNARELLCAALEYGDHLDHGKVIDAVLAWPESSPNAELIALIKEKIAGFTAYHVFMEAAGWDRSPEVGLAGLAYVDRLREMVGETPGIDSLRASFHEQAGDLAAAERDLLCELERTPADSWRRSTYEQSLERLRKQLSSAATEP